MPDHSLGPTLPLGGAEPRTDRFPGLVIAETPAFVLASLARRAGDNGFQEAASATFGVALPGPGRMAAGNGFELWWSGPDQWMVSATPADTEGPEDRDDIAAILVAAFGATASVTEQTGGWARFDLAGGGAVAVLERVWPLDTARMDGGSAARSAIEHMGVFVLCHRAGTGFSVLGPRSYAGSLHHALVTAAAAALD